MDEKNSLLPEGWADTQLGQTIQLSKEKIHPSECPDTIYLSLEHIESDSNKIKGQGIAQDVKSTKSVFYDGDILYGRLRPYLNKVYMPNFQGICSTDILVLKATGAIENKFLLKFLSQNSFVKYAHANSSGINLPRVNFKTISEYLIKLPPINEQKRISNKIGTLQAKSKKAKKALEIAKPLLDRLRQSILASAFRGDLTADWRKKNPDVEPASVLLERIRVERRKKWEETELTKMRDKGKEPKNDKWKSKYKEPVPVDISELPELPESWCWVTLELILEESRIGLIRAAREQSEENGTPYIRMGHYNSSGSWNLESLTYVEATEKEIEIYELKMDDVLFNTRNSYELVGKTSIWPDRMPGYVYNNNLLRLRFCNNVLPSLVAYQMQSPFFLNLLLQSKSATTNICAIYTRELLKKPIPIPSLGEQKQIANIIKLLFEKKENTDGVITELTSKMLKIDQAIFKKAFQGNLVPQDPNDEPATKLLEKIRMFN